MSATTVIIDIIRGIVRELRGEDVRDWTTEKVIAAIADKVKESIAATIHSELKVYANTLGLQLATAELAEAASNVLRSMREAETSPTVPKLALDIEVVGPDEKIVDTVVTEVPEDIKP